MFEILEVKTLVLVYASYFKSLLSSVIIRCCENRLPNVRTVPHPALLLYRCHNVRIIRII
jgi:hypothetical protein